MTIPVRGATPDDYPILRDIIVRAFPKGSAEEAPLWDYITGADPSVSPEHVRVAVHEGRPVACTVVVPRQVNTPRGPVSGAIITLVACEPALQKQGFGSATNRDALAFMAEHGMAVGVMYGHPSYYPRFGYAPVLPHWDTTVKLEQLPPGGEELLRPAAQADLPALTALYAQGPGRHLLASERVAAPWMWHLRSPEQYALYVLPGLTGYALISPNEQENALDVHEHASVDAPAARLLLAALRAECEARGREKLRIFGPPTSLLARLGALMGGARRYFPAGPGMAVITRWEPLLPAGYTVTDAGLAFQGRPVLQADRAALTQLLLGYRSAADLALVERATIPGDAAEQLVRDFPKGHQRWSFAPFWF